MKADLLMCLKSHLHAHNIILKKEGTLLSVKSFLLSGNLRETE